MTYLAEAILLVWNGAQPHLLPDEVAHVSGFVIEDIDEWELVVMSQVDAMPCCG
jgi:hypothetical protein